MKRWRTDGAARPSLAAALAFLLVAAAAGWPDAGDAESPRSPAGIFSPAKLERVGDYLRNEIATGKIPGAIILVQQHGHPVYFEKLGVIDVATRRPMSEDAIFRLYSMSKPITSVAAMMLVEDGKLALDDPVVEIHPGLCESGSRRREARCGRRLGPGTRARQPPDHHRRPAAPHLRPHLRLLRRQRGAQALCEFRPVRGRFRQCRICRTHRQAAACRTAGNAVGLRPLDRRARPRHRGGVGKIAVPVREGAPARSARNERDGVLPRRCGEAVR